MCNDDIKIVEGAGYINDIKRLIEEYTQILNRDLSFQGIENELADLESKYLPPHGRLLCAVKDNVVVGCIAYYKHSDTRCEMKRLFVEPAYRGHAIGGKLISELLQYASNDGYSEMVLDTIAPLKNAIRLYRQYGFEETEPYYDNPMEDVIYMKKSL